MKNLYQVMQEVTDKVMGPGTYVEINHFDPSKGEYPWNKNMKRFPIDDSSRIIELGYDDETRVAEVQFKDKSVYHYFDVPQAAFYALYNADSKGSHLQKNWVGVYGYKRIS